jgi:nitrogen-specific signal transduction histidine kinase
MRAVTLLARAAAHEINNPLTIVTGGLQLLGRRLPANSEDAQWIARAAEGAGRIKDIVTRMNEITRIEEEPPRGLLPPMLDIRKSSEPR